MQRASSIVASGLWIAFWLLPVAHADWKSTVGGVLGGGGQTSGTTSGMPESMVADGLKQALEVGVERAVSVLGASGGFLGDPSVRIPLPDTLTTVEKGLRATGQGALADEFITTMNQAAESAVPETVGILTETIESMSLEDAQQILNGPDDAATQYFRERNETRLQEAIRPIVAQATDETGATAAFKRMTGSVGGMLSAFGAGDSLDLDSYVTDKALDGLFLKLAAEEKRIRTDPLARTTELLKGVFGS